ncbi:DUF4870 family protein [Pararhodospirillum oryzae]|uniref:Membrane protein n=1 Tax=Pararhodospirillum oryzae TaxID=478448 RepID=A0A512H473_9PROT|nr:hypothetical protein [Pararhodospirillum oryzae]GEO80266.1 membrane protein [Pararhodospirillum oryzae]
MEPTPNNEDTAIVSRKGICLIVYVLYIIGFSNGLTAIVGVFIAHLQDRTSSPLEKSHFQFQIRTFWYGLLMLAVGAMLSIVIVGYAILFAWLVWTLLRCVKGLLLLNENKPIADPNSLLLG